jgi:tRNA U34 5-methylaminomethyl-2-thiouridine-forming methyltransferase MnmC
MGETYHSVHGALTESVHVFIKAGLHEVTKNNTSISIFEVGLGTGLNSWLTENEELPSTVSIQYAALEPYPLEVELIEQLVSQETFKTSKHLISLIHSDKWDQDILLRENFLFRKIQQRLEDYNVSQQYNLIYMDAFAPNKQAEVWSLENIKKLFDILLPGGVLVTYCANGAFKRNLKTCGFVVESLPGPPGKFEMTRAFKAV